MMKKQSPPTVIPQWQGVNFRAPTLFYMVATSLNVWTSRLADNLRQARIAIDKRGETRTDTVSQILKGLVSESSACQCTVGLEPAGVSVRHGKIVLQ